MVGPPFDREWSPYSSRTDRELWVLFDAGDDEAFEELRRRYSSLVFRVAEWIVRDVAKSEEVTQDVFVALWRSRKYDPDLGPLSAYLRTVAHNSAISLLRREGREIPESQISYRPSGEESAAISPFDRKHEAMWVSVAVSPDVANEDLRDLFTCLRNYSAHDQAIVLLNAAGYKHREILERLGLLDKADNHITRAQSRILRQLKTCLSGDHCPLPAPCSIAKGNCNG